MIAISDTEFTKLATFIKQYTGIHLKTEKKTLVVGRLSNLLSDKGIGSFSDYYKLLGSDSSGRELSVLVDKITTNHTYFMRESQHFQFLEDTVLPNLKKQGGIRDLRLWCAASSSGEEPYTLAMILDAYTKKEGLMWDKKLLATDLSLSILETAKQGRYGKQKLDVLPKMWLLKYFDKVDSETYQANGFLKSQVIYRRFNLLEPVYPFKKKFHVIFCRNVMIYFDQETKEKVIEQMYNQLEYGGYLFIGHSESINREKSQFQYVQPAVYRKI